ncbi:MAG TPA: hypothetical protein PKE39_09765 [Ignavibacteria bacterium]|nr:hypothetical protein [Ignavibacteria bacterium]HMQ99298.1 hypothetical protein [Ignavibacteria bacterium]
MIPDTEITALIQSLNKMTSEITRLIPVGRNSAEKEPGTAVNSLDKPAASSAEIAGYFGIMLDTTKSMLGNMGLMDTGFTKTVQIILQLLSSITGSGGGFGGFFSGILGVIGGIVGGPLGAAAGGGIGSLFGRQQLSLNSQLNSSINSSSQMPQIINQVVVKNPVTFTRAFDVEVKTRSLRGGIDL